jgi:hypothetical protein
MAALLASMCEVVHTSHLPQSPAATGVERKRWPKKQNIKFPSSHEPCCTRRFGRCRGRLVNPASLPERRRTICAKTGKQTFGALRACQPVVVSCSPSAQTDHLDSSWRGFWPTYQYLKERGTSTSLVDIACRQFLERYLAYVSLLAMAWYGQRVQGDCEVLRRPCDLQLGCPMVVTTRLSAWVELLINIKLSDASSLQQKQIDIRGLCRPRGMKSRTHRG